MIKHIHTIISVTTRIEKFSQTEVSDDADGLTLALARIRAEADAKSAIVTQYFGKGHLSVKAHSIFINDDGTIWTSTCSAHPERKLDCPICHEGWSCTQEEYLEQLATTHDRFPPCMSCGYGFANTNCCPSCRYPRNGFRND